MKHKLRKIITAAVLAAVVCIPSAVYAVQTGISTDNTANTVTYNAKNEVTGGDDSYEPAPPDDDHVFAGWATTKAKADAGTVDFSPLPHDLSNADLNGIKNGETKHLYAVWKDPVRIKYAVSVYGINADGAGTVTFGPAQGNHVKTSKPAHIAKDSETSSDMCVHNHTWTEVIAQIKKDPTVFQNCITNHCTISVPLKLNDTLKGQHADDYADAETGDGPGMLRDELKGDFTFWQPGTGSGTYQYGDPEGGWPASRIRAVLNGTDEHTDVAKANQTYVYLRTEAEEATGADSNWNWRNRTLQDISTITSSNCLLSCFPKELQESIVPKDVKSDTVYNDTSGNSVTTQDKLWLFSMQEFGHTGQRSNEGTTYPARTSISRTYFYYIYGGKSSSVSSGDLWLRSLHRYDANYVYFSYGFSSSYNNAGNGSYGAAPGFVVG